MKEGRKRKMAKYATLKEDIYTWNRNTGKWDVIPKGTKGRIIDYMLVPLSITYKLIFYEGTDHSVIEEANIKYLEHDKNGRLLN